MFADDKVQIADSETKLKGIQNEFGLAYEMGSLK